MKITVSGVTLDANPAIPNEDTSGLNVDTVAPSISSVAGPLPGIYLFGETLQFVVTYDEAVNVFRLSRA